MSETRSLSGDAGAGVRNAADRPAILAVDDLPDNLEMLRDILQGVVEADLVTAGGGKEALAVASGHDFALAILDVGLPGMDGFELARALRRLPLNLDLPVLFVTGECGAADQILKGYEAGAFDYLTKPYSLPVLRGKVKALLALDRQRRDLSRQRDRLEAQVAERVREVERLAGMVACARDAIALIGRDHRYLEANASYGRMVGRPPAEIIGRTVAEVLGEKVFREHVQERMDRCLAGEEVYFEMTREVPERGWRLTDVNYTPFRAPDGAVIAVLAIIHDVTDLHAAEQGRREQQKELESIYASAPVILAVVDADYRIRRINRAGLGDGKLQAADAIGWRCGEVFRCRHQRDDPRGCGFGPSCPQCQLRQAVSHTLTTKEPRENLEAVIPVVREGRPEERAFLVSTAPMTLRGVPMVQVALQDVTERQRVETMLHDSEERYRRLYESSRDAIMTLAPPKWKFTAGNPATLAMFAAKDEADFCSRAPWEYAPERQPDGRPSAEAAREMLDKAMREGSCFFEWTHRRLDGKEFPATVLLNRVDIGGQPLLQATVRDISELRAANEQLAQAQRMESIGRLAGGVAHDFNNMLSVIIGYGEMVAGKLGEKDPMRDLVKEIVDAGNRSAALTRQLLAFSRKQTLRLEVLDANRILKNLQKMLRRLIGEDIELKLALADDLSQVLADPGQIEQVIMNLAVNARDAMPRGGTLSIKTANVVLDEQYASRHLEVEPGDYVMISVTDTGCGMDAEIAKHIFEPFFTTKPEGKGTGLGLSTVYGIVKQSRGGVWVYSEPGMGTTFKIYLPCTWAETAPAAAPAPAPLAKGKGTTVLVAEDEPALRKLIEGLLEQQGYLVTLAASGAEALRLVEEKHLQPDLLVTDTVMPGMSGWVLSEHIRNRFPAVKLLFMSGYTETVIGQHGIFDSTLPFLPKPFTPNDFINTVNGVLGRTDDAGKNARETRGKPSRD